MVKDKSRNYAQEKAAHKTPAYRAANAARKRARYKMEKKHGKARLKGLEIHHKDKNPNNNASSNLAITSRSANRKDQPKRKT